MPVKPLRHKHNLEGLAGREEIPSRSIFKGLSRLPAPNPPIENIGTIPGLATELRRLSAAVLRLSPSHQHPEQFLGDKEIISERLRQLSRRVNAQ